jgi:hypothetical protein
MDKNTLLHLRVGPDDVKTLDELCSAVFPRQQVASMLLIAAISAVRENGGHLSFPPKFAVGSYEPDTERILKLNQPKSVKRL